LKCVKSSRRKKAAVQPLPVRFLFPLYLSFQCSPSFTSQPRLPVELYDLILSHLWSSEPILASCCLVSSSFLQAARPLLYHSFDFSLYADSIGGGWLACVPDDLELVETLLANPHLCATVQDLSFEISYLGDEETDVLHAEYGERWRENNGKEDGATPDSAEEWEDLSWELQRCWIADGDLERLVRTLTSQATSLKSFSITTWSSGAEFDYIWDGLQYLPRLTSITMSGYTHGASFDEPELAPLPAFPALRDFTLAVNLYTGLKGEENIETRLRRWCRERDVELDLSRGT
jgi:hypothetical protein